MTRTLFTVPGKSVLVEDDQELDALVADAIQAGLDYKVSPL